MIYVPTPDSGPTGETPWNRRRAREGCETEAVVETTGRPEGPSAEAICTRSDLFERRRLMDDWAIYLKRKRRSDS